VRAFGGGVATAKLLLDRSENPVWKTRPENTLKRRCYPAFGRAVRLSGFHPPFSVSFPSVARFVRQMVAEFCVPAVWPKRAANSVRRPSGWQGR
jgi:hypothetical protein